MTAEPTDQTRRPSGVENLEDLYELSPMQQGMLFHSVYAPESGAYFEQSVFTIAGRLDYKHFQNAWQRVINRHPILRSAFLWKDLERPVQAVYREVRLPIQEHDWRGESEEKWQSQLEGYLLADRNRGFPLESAPLMRLSLFRIEDDLYKFAFSRHHLILDRWSRAIVLKEAFSLYEAFVREKEPSLPQPRPYGDYIEWIAAQNTESAAEFWKTTLSGFTDPTSLGVDRILDPLRQGKAFAEERVRLSENTTSQLKTFARTRKLTLNTITQAAWAALLSRYSGTEDVLFGVTVAGRPPELKGIESMVGLFINTLPLRVKIPSQSSVASWLEDLQRRQHELQRYEYSSLLDIQGWSEVPRGVRLFESIFVFENLPIGSTHQTEDGSIKFISDRGLGSATGYPLTVIVSPGTQLTVQIVYDQERFKQDSIIRMLGHYQALLENLVTQSHRKVTSVPMLTAGECQQLSEWNHTSESFGTASIIDKFESQVELTPQRAALIFNDQEMAYQALNSRANQLAHYLRISGVGPDTRVGIFLERGLEMMVAVLGILKAGGAYVPLDPAYPYERLRYMVKAAQCSFVITTGPASNGPLFDNVPLIDLCREALREQSTANPQTSIAAENLAYVIYTSGSTGLPKGVALTHGGLANLISWQLADRVRFSPARTLQFASLSFDVSFQEMFSTWCSGGTLLVVSQDLRTDAAQLLQSLNQYNVERCFFPFSYLHHLAEIFTLTGTMPASLRQIISAGEQLEVTPQIAKLCNSLKDVTLCNQYGPTESHVVTSYDLSLSLEDWPSLPPIGRPISNTSIYVLDANLQLLPIGVTGELYIAGSNLARGYLNQPELTADRFIPCPFSNHRGARMYKTGDLARFLASGDIEFLGRIDEQVKIRGFRVELGEIETILLTHPQVKQAVVVARADQTGERKLIAYIVAGGDHKLLASGCRSYLKERLPYYMIPAEFVPVETLPLTSSGKVNRGALPALIPNSSYPEIKYESPRTPAEKKLAEIWSVVLHREHVGVYDNFFDLGGHSLLATQLISRVRNAFKVELPLRNLFESPTVAELASVIVEFENSMKNEAADTITRDPNGEAEELLKRIDQLSDEDVDSLLRQALAETGNNE